MSDNSSMRMLVESTANIMPAMMDSIMNTTMNPGKVRTIVHIVLMHMIYFINLMLSFEIFKKFCLNERIDLPHLNDTRGPQFNCNNIYAIRHKIACNSKRSELVIFKAHLTD